MELLTYGTKFCSSISSIMRFHSGVLRLLSLGEMGSKIPWSPTQEARRASATRQRALGAEFRRKMRQNR